MFKINDYIVYKSDVCKVVDIRYNSMKKEDYYVLIPILDNSLKIDLPISNRGGYLRPLITREEIDEIINDISKIEVIESSDKLIENEYRKLLNTYLHRDLIKIIKTIYIRNKSHVDNKKKISERDNSYFSKAETRLYTEFGLVLGLNFDDTRDFIIEQLKH